MKVMRHRSRNTMDAESISPCSGGGREIRDPARAMESAPMADSISPRLPGRPAGRLTIPGRSTGGLWRSIGYDDDQLGVQVLERGKTGEDESREVAEGFYKPRNQC